MQTGGDLRESVFHGSTKERTIYVYQRNYYVIIIVSETVLGVFNLFSILAADEV